MLLLTSAVYVFDKCFCQKNLKKISLPSPSHPRVLWAPVYNLFYPPQGARPQSSHPENTGPTHPNPPLKGRLPPGCGHAAPPTPHFKKIKFAGPLGPERVRSSALILICFPPSTSLPPGLQNMLENGLSEMGVALSALLFRIFCPF